MPPDKQKLLLIEVWGLGDLVIATGFLRRALEQYDVTLLAKPYARELLARDFPQLRVVAWDPPWTAFRGKYQLWRWPWRQIGQLLRDLRRERFAAAVSVRPDPRDHLVMWLANAGARYGFSRLGSALFLNHPLPRPERLRHRVEDWRQLGVALGLAGMEAASPELKQPSAINARETSEARAEVCFHLGARVAVRRWPESYYREIIVRLRAEADFHLTLIPDLDGYGSGLADLADSYLARLNLSELLTALGRARMVFCNDSAPEHMAAALGVPVIAFFGPQEPALFRPWGDQHLVVVRDLCPYRPCSDYCRFPEPYCLTKLLPSEVWPEIREFALRHLPARQEGAPRAESKPTQDRDGSPSRP